MTLVESLELVVAHTKHERYRHLATMPGGELVIMRLAAEFTGQPIPPPTPGVAEAVETARKINACKVRQSNSCGCTDRSALCFRSGLPIIVSHAQCEACVNNFVTSKPND